MSLSLRPKRMMIAEVENLESPVSVDSESMLFKHMFYNFDHFSDLSDKIKQQLYGHLPPISKTISKTIQRRRTRHTGHYWRSKGELISDVLLWTSSYRRASVGWPTRPYLLICADSVFCRLEDMPKTIDNRLRKIRAKGMMMMIISIIMFLVLSFLAVRFFQ